MSINQDKNTKRDFKGIWISKEIWLSKDLTLIEKMFLVEIDSLDNENGCFASNAYFSDFFDISKGRCTQIIKSLEIKKRVSIQLERKGKQVIKRIIRVVSKLNTPSENIKQPYLENDEDNNTTNKNTKKTSDYIVFLDYLKAKCKYKTKITKTKDGEKLFKQIEDKKQLIKDYIQHQEEKKEFAVRITAFMEDYKTVYKQEQEERFIEVSF